MGFLYGTLLALSAVSSFAQGQGFPNKPVKLIVPSSAGGGLDVVGRLVGNKLSSYWGQQIIVDNRPGAAMAIGTGATAKSPPDGYTVVLVNDGALIVNPLAVQATPYTYRDFAPVGVWVTAPLIVTVHDRVPVKTFADLLAYLRANPGKLNFAVADDNSRLHSELFKSVAKVEYTHIPYKGASLAVNALMAGEADLSLMEPVAGSNAAKSGRVRLLAVASAQRSKALPDVPTADEAGLPGYLAGTWAGLLAPAGTPSAIVDKINADVRRALAEPDVIAKLESFSLDVRPGSAEEFRQRISAEHDKWARLIKERNLKFGD